MTIQLKFDLVRPDFRLTVDVEVPAHGVTALFGRSGCGKTTLLRCVAGLEPAVQGRLTVNGACWQDEARFLPAHRRPVGYVFQEGQLFPHLSVLGNLMYGYRRIAQDRRIVQPHDVAELLGLEALLERRITEISGGQRQRVAMGRALLTSPRILLMDEPLAALDEISKAEILPYFERLHEDLSVPVLYVSHAIEEVSRLADHMLFMEDGVIRAEGPLRELITRADLPLVHGEQASAVLIGNALSHLDDEHLSCIHLPGGMLYVPRIREPTGGVLRVRVLARDVSVARQPPLPSSILNCVECTIKEIIDDPHPGHCLLKLQLGDQYLLSRITQRSRRQLELALGDRVWASVKGVALT
ncbi:molybdenum ABC transporter ATP-binding protein [Wenzhouxiangella limi]|uniref:Molybdenum ABC transporter ATP-binding protein n=1 Tax=Wenzhouxiangella limi TaxID=2707351 RepID=A0A845UXA4_9GAMM|nr:molybdenum ABC transporter ATP-binding protein [Wenzhouxiangella limi]NDY96493.1 molybdenum ABC transporter ATP-binding protein [Wenzhouxiangella limi]